MIYLIATIRAIYQGDASCICQPSLWKPSVAVVIVVVVAGGGDGVRDFFAHADFSLWSVPSRLSPIMAHLNLAHSSGPAQISSFLHFCLSDLL